MYNELNKHIITLICLLCVKILKESCLRNETGTCLQDYEALSNIGSADSQSVCVVCHSDTTGRQ